MCVYKSYMPSFFGLGEVEGQKLGLDVDYMAERSVLPILVISGGISEQWNKQHPERKMTPGDSVVEAWLGRSCRYI
jgi:hypothetical protein